MVLFISVRGDEIFEAEHLPSYAKTYILPKQMIRKKSHSEEDEWPRKNSHDRAKCCKTWSIRTGQGEGGQKEIVLEFDI